MKSRQCISMQKGISPAGAKADAVVVENPILLQRLTIGFTRGYLSSQAYAAQFKNKDIRPNRNRWIMMRPPTRSNTNGSAFTRENLSFIF